ncbi:protein kinase [Sorangium sp. So ce327]|uniref:protein kinase domain-containing protein n=1 Tax=Sorangium sp. So ce327 TaxID=3133301 RepID=UPI003F627E2D
MTTIRSSHFELIGTTPHRHEQEGLDWLATALPTYGPHGGYALFSFQTDDGRRYEIDAIAMTAHCLYIIEMKSWRGEVIEGDARHLVTWSAQRGREVVDHPLPLLETKKNALMARVRGGARRLGRDVADKLGGLWFESLVWLTHAEGIKLGEHDAARTHVVVGRQELGDALRQARFPGARDDLPRRANTHDTLKALRRVLTSSEFGLGKIDKPLTVLDGRFDLKALVEEGPDYQDHWAEPHGLGPRCRVRSYLVPRGDRALAQRLDHRVEREAKLLLDLSDHPDILALEQFEPRGPLGPALVFRGFPGKTLEAFVKEHRQSDGRSDLVVDDKLAILRRVADALAFCHRNDIVHGALSPEAVLVHRGKAALEVKLTRFALAAGGDPASESPRLFTRLAGASASLYEAPEIALGSPATAASDVFSLGALAYYLLAEEPPAATSAELAQRLARDGGLVISAVRDDLFPAGAKNLDLVLRSATSLDPTERVHDFPTPLDFVYLLEEALTAPEMPPIAAPPPVAAQPAPEIDPLDAGKGTLLGGDLEVLGELGSGATARVFKVKHPTEGEVALKVPLSDAHDTRIAREGEVLARLRRIPGVDRIAHLVDTRTLAGRTCLLVQFAGERTLADEIRAEGALSLDYARRWGEDLLTALRSLEEAGVQHRDIKPANIGLTSGTEKGKKRLLLFDFSLSQRAADDLAIGTPAYKDPELAARGRWDDAADRWAAAVTLHEMFTGVRPAPLLGARPGQTAVRVESDRLDADVRDGLVRFFERAFRLTASERFPTADDMRDAFIKALHKVPEHDSRGADEPVLQAADLTGLGAEARVDALPLSTRQRNALDRMGIYSLHDLAQLSSNRLGGVRGVGAKTARSLVDLAELVRKHLEISVSDVPPPFFRGFTGARRRVDEDLEDTGGSHVSVGPAATGEDAPSAGPADAGRGSAPAGRPARRLSPALSRRLLEAGLVDSVTVASAPEKQVRNLVNRARKEGAPEAPRDLTAWLEGLVDAERPPTTLGAAIELIAPSHGKGGSASLRRVRQYLGLEDVAGFPRHGSMLELAKVAGKTRALVSIDLGKARERWLGEVLAALPAGAPPIKPREFAVLERVFAAVQGALAASAGVAPLGRAAAAVMEAFPLELDLSLDAAQRAAEALVRTVTEIDASRLGGPEDARLRLRRVGKGAAALRAGEALVAWDRGGFELAEALGKEADALVDGGNVVAEATAAARLREALGETARVDAPRAEQARALPDRALVALAAATAERARLSVRGELYPVGLSAERALLLSAAAIAGKIDPDELQRRVRARYPECAELPRDPALIEVLAAKLGLRFDAQEGALIPRERTLLHGSTELGTLRSTSSAVAEPAPSPPRVVAAPAATAAEIPFQPRRERAEGDIAGATAVRVFDEEIQRARREGAFRVLLWRGERAGDGRPLARGAPNADVVARAVARRLGGDMRFADALLIDAAEAVATEKKLKSGLVPAIAADDRGPDGPAWPRLLELMRLAAASTVEAVLAWPRLLVLTRLGLLARYDLLSAVAELAAGHRAPASMPARAATFVVLPVYAGEGAVVEVAADVAPHVGASPGTFLVPVPGLLPHEILDVPAAWLERHAERRTISSTSLPAQRA